MRQSADAARALQAELDAMGVGNPAGPVESYADFRTRTDNNFAQVEAWATRLETQQMEILRLLTEKKASR